MEVPALLSGADLINPACDELSMMTYLSGFRLYHDKHGTGSGDKSEFEPQPQGADEAEKKRQEEEERRRLEDERRRQEEEDRFVLVETTINDFLLQMGLTAISASAAAVSKKRLIVSGVRRRSDSGRPKVRVSAPSFSMQTYSRGRATSQGRGGAPPSRGRPSTAVA
jgi:hypothetical protein